MKTTYAGGLGFKPGPLESYDDTPHYIACLDLDDAVYRDDSDIPCIREWAKPIVKAAMDAGTYVAHSSSGFGLHVFLLADENDATPLRKIAINPECFPGEPPPRKKGGMGVEIFGLPSPNGQPDKKANYIKLTGQKFRGAQSKVCRIPDVVTWLEDLALAYGKIDTSTSGDTSRPKRQPGDLTGPWAVAINGLAISFRETVAAAIFASYRVQQGRVFIPAEALGFASSTSELLIDGGGFTNFVAQNHEKDESKGRTILQCICRDYSEALQDPFDTFAGDYPGAALAILDVIEESHGEQDGFADLRKRIERDNHRSDGSGFGPVDDPDMVEDDTQAEATPKAINKKAPAIVRFASDIVVPGKRPRPAPLVRRVLFKKQTSLIVAQPGVAKTQLALHLSAAVALGEEWAGHKTEQAGVLFLCFEGDVEDQLNALTEEYGDAIKAAPIAVCAPEFSLTNMSPKTMDKLKAIVDQTKGVPGFENGVGLIVIDTFAAAFRGIEENSGSEMNEGAQFLREIGREFDAHVMTIHHLGKDISKGSRGANALPGGLDTVITLAVDDKIANRIHATVTRQRKGRVLATILFDRKMIELDENTDPYFDAEDVARFGPETVPHLTLYRNTNCRTDGKDFPAAPDGEDTDEVKPVKKAGAPKRHNSDAARVAQIVAIHLATDRPISIESVREYMVDHKYPLPTDVSLRKILGRLVKDGILARCRKRGRFKAPAQPDFDSADEV